MKFSYAISNVFSNFAEFRGRAGRHEYWWWCLFVALALVAMVLVDNIVSAPLLGFEMFSMRAGHPLSALTVALLALPTLAVSSRRLHDVGKPGWLLLAGFVPVLGNLYLLWLLTRPTSTRDNRYGSSVFGLQRT
ncbi:DUF805 domain-containing protein [Albimonas pacifica]|uniref:Uncharacterized membrane protein YhaH, DUF805 family n=1 Tax=Albimonas pacifica TaxID=1114924 RepID=A0A1I3HN46_9RHOB|nr:DUF805 domain-containing protein [Albimonas pacifica]SFI37144.1 Uncharacterized membrane protein YhaH, DUF805 family [Albimonas pacifica]